MTTIDVIRREIARAMAGMVSVDAGVVKQVNWKEQTARVRLASSGQVSGWLRIGAGAAWAQGGSATPLRAGDEVGCLFLDGKAGGMGFVVCRLYGACAVPAGLSEQCFGVTQGTHKVLFDGQGNVVAEVTSYKVTATGAAEIDGTSVVLGAGVSAAVKYEELAAALTAYATAIDVRLNALGAFHSLPPVPTPLALTGARAGKVRVG